MPRSNLREVTIEELKGIFSYEAVQEIELFQSMPLDEQQQTPLDRINNERLFPKSTLEQYGRDLLFGILACNISIYTENIEESIDNDELITDIIKAREIKPENTSQYTCALRVRRSIIALLTSYNDEISVVVELPPTNIHTPTTAA